eukprot:CCRYP_014455-RA/>CCRYP_014455-RA protein AED:0.26 eAED:0.26 QI:0/-1/0/1/-1/1/1/0/564
MPHEGEVEPVEAEILDAVAAAAEALGAEHADDPHHHDDAMEAMPMPTPVPPHAAPQDASHVPHDDEAPVNKDGQHALEADHADVDEDDRDLHDAMTLDDPLNAPLILEEDAIQVDDGDIRSMAACIKQLQAQQRQQTQLILALRDTLHDVVAAQSKLQGDLHALAKGRGGNISTDSSKRPPAANSKPATARTSSLLPATATVAAATTSKQPHHAALLYEANSLLPPTEPSDTTDEQIDQILHDKQSQHGSWPVHRLKKWIEEADLQKIRLHRTEKHAHVPIRIPRTDKNKEGRLICKLCSGGKCNRNTTWMCSTCEVPLCIDTVDGDGEQTHHVRWHRCLDLREEHLRCNALLRGRREGKKRGLLEGNGHALVEEGMQAQMMGGGVKRGRLEMEQNDSGGGGHGDDVDDNDTGGGGSVHMESEHHVKLEHDGVSHHYDEHHVVVNNHHHLEDDHPHVNDGNHHHHLHHDDDPHVNHHHVNDQHMNDPHVHDLHHVNNDHYVNDHPHNIMNHPHVNNDHIHDHHGSDQHVNDPYIHDHHGEAHVNSMHGEGVVEVDHHMHVHVDL